MPQRVCFVRGIRNWVFLSFHWVFSGAKWKKEFKKGKKGRIVVTNAKTLPHSVITYIWTYIGLVHCLLRGEEGKWEFLNFQKRKKGRVATNAKTLLHSVIIFNWTNINIVCVVSLFTKRASMGGVVLQALWRQNSEPASTIFIWAQIYYNRVRNNFGIIGHNSPCISFLYIFYYMSWSNHVNYLQSLCPS